MNSKNPFDFPGVSVSYKHGITSQKAAGDNYYYDIAFRAANKFSDKFAAKFTVSYVEGEDWHAVTIIDDLNHIILTMQGNCSLDKSIRSVDQLHKRRCMYPDYDGVNVYGDIAQSINMDQAFAGLFYLDCQQGLLQ